MSGEEAEFILKDISNNTALQWTEDDPHGHFSDSSSISSPFSDSSATMSPPTSPEQPYTPDSSLRSTYPYHHPPLSDCALENCHCCPMYDPHEAHRSAYESSSAHWNQGPFDSPPPSPAEATYLNLNLSLNQVMPLPACPAACTPYPYSPDSSLQSPSPHQPPRLTLPQSVPDREDEEAGNYHEWTQYTHKKPDGTCSCNNRKNNKCVAEKSKILA